MVPGSSSCLNPNPEASAHPEGYHIYCSLDPSHGALCSFLCITMKLLPPCGHTLAPSIPI